LVAVLGKVEPLGIAEFTDQPGLYRQPPRSSCIRCDMEHKC
jgi:hypothetical protein